MSNLPPGQRAVRGFPRFGVDTRRPPPVVEAGSPILVVVERGEALALSDGDLASLPHVEVRADFHCVAGWSAVGLTWGGVAFRTFYERLVEPMDGVGDSIGYVVFVGADGYRSIVMLQDALAVNVLLADRLDGEPLSGEHGAPVRLVSPDQYGFVSTKHLCRIELYESEPPAFFHPDRSIQRALRTVRPHRRARVWREERHRFVPSWLIRPVYHRLVRLPAPLLRSADP